MDGHKAGMLQKREWRAGAVSNDPTTISLHLSSLYSPWVSWAMLVRKFLTAKANPEQLQDFINSELGEPFDKADARIYSDQLQAREGGYEEGQKWVKVEPYSHAFKDAVEDEDYATFIWCDVQQNYLVAAVRTAARSGESGLVWSGELNGFQALEDLRVDHNALFVGIDHRHRGEEVRQWVYDHRHLGYFVTMGASRPFGTLYDSHSLDIDQGRRKGSAVRRTGRAREILELTIDPNQAKDMLEKCITADPAYPRWMVPAGYSQNTEYANQMQSEQRVGNKWEKIGQRPNHRWDAEACLIACMKRFGFFNMVLEGNNEESEPK
jgi:hypothetical protein